MGTRKEKIKKNKKQKHRKKTEELHPNDLTRTFVVGLVDLPGEF